MIVNWSTDPLQWDGDVAALRDIAQVTKTISPGEFTMRTWLCSTAGCMIGHWILSHHETAWPLVLDAPSGNVPQLAGSTVLQPNAAISTRLRISEPEALFLFDPDSLCHWVGVSYPSEWCQLGNWLHKNRFKHTPEFSAARVEKYIAYKLRKRDLLEAYEAASKFRPRGSARQARQTKNAPVAEHQ